jgi:hypothetical protein
LRQIITVDLIDQTQHHRPVGLPVPRLRGRRGGASTRHIRPTSVLGCSRHPWQVVRSYPHERRLQTRSRPGLAALQLLLDHSEGLLESSQVQRLVLTQCLWGPDHPARTRPQRLTSSWQRPRRIRSLARFSATLLRRQRSVPHPPSVVTTHMSRSPLALNPVPTRPNEAVSSPLRVASTWTLH